MELTLIFSFILPLFFSLLNLLIPSLLKRVFSLLFFSHFCICLLLTVDVFQKDVIATSIGNWAAPYGIVLIADPLAAILLTCSSFIFFCSTLNQPLCENRKLLTQLFLLEAGVTLSFITGDLFNLFVAFEIMLTASYGIFVSTTKKENFKYIYTYLSTNILASLFFLIAISIFYGSIGSLNFASLKEHLQTSYNSLLLIPIFAIVLVMGIKSGLFPLYFWLPDSYPKLPGYLAAIFAGTLSKVGIYGFMRIYFTVFNASFPIINSTLIPLGCLTMLLGVLGAVSKNSWKGILSYHILSQIGYVIFALALSTPLAIASALIFLIHNMVVKSSLFLVADIVEKKFRSHQLNEMGGLLTTVPFLGGIFLIQALSLAGIPPLSGFWGKYMIFYEGIYSESYIAVLIAVVVSFLTLFSMIKIWNMAFLGEVKQEFLQHSSSNYSGLLMLTAFSLLLGIGINDAFDLSLQTAQSLLDSSRYVQVALDSGVKGVVP